MSDQLATRERDAARYVQTQGDRQQRITPTDCPDAVAHRQCPAARPRRTIPRSTPRSVARPTARRRSPPPTAPGIARTEKVITGLLEFSIAIGNVVLLPGGARERSRRFPWADPA